MKTKIKKLRASSIFEKVEVIFHLKKNWDSFPFLRKLRSSSIVEKLRLSLIFEKIVVFHFGKINTGKKWRTFTHLSKKECELRKL